MAWVELLTLFVLLQYMAFGVLVGRARGKFGVDAPATTGHAVFERYFRVQQNTLELVVLFLPSLWIAAHYWNPHWMAGIGAVFLIGRVLYLRGYVNDPAQRSLGFGLSIVPTLILLLAALTGVVRGLL